MGSKSTGSQLVRVHIKKVQCQAVRVIFSVQKGRTEIGSDRIVLTFHIKRIRGQRVHT